MFAASEEWKARYPDACFGVLIMEGVDNTGKCPALEERKDALEQSLRTLYAGKSRKEIGAEHPFASYGRYYKTFGKNYHVLFQVESVALKEKPIFSPSPLVAVMFMAELKNGLLTAGHDLDRTEPPFLLDVAKGGETFTSLGGTQRTLLPEDMYFSDRNGILSSIIYGPDSRTRIHPGTGRVLYTVYGVPGIEPKEIELHLERLGEYVTLAAPDASVEERRVLTTS